MTFREEVLRVVASIPRGAVMTYKQLAIAAGYPKAARAVGNVLSKNFDLKIPCHRVIRSDGTPGGYNRGAKRKRELLKQESKRK